MLEVIIHPMEQEIAPGSTYRSGVFLFGRTLYTNMKNKVSRQKMISMRILMTKPQNRVIQAEAVSPFGK